jgi:hypothetical protein
VIPVELRAIATASRMEIEGGSELLARWWATRGCTEVVSSSTTPLRTYKRFGLVGEIRMNSGWPVAEVTPLGEHVALLIDRRWRK